MTYLMGLPDSSVQVVVFFLLHVTLIIIDPVAKQVDRFRFEFKPEKTMVRKNSLRLHERQKKKKDSKSKAVSSSG